MSCWHFPHSWWIWQRNDIVSDVRGVCRGSLPTHPTLPPGLTEVGKKINGNLSFKVTMSLFTPLQANMPATTTPSWCLFCMFRCCCAVARLERCGTHSTDWRAVTAYGLNWGSEVLSSFATSWSTSRITCRFWTPRVDALRQDGSLSELLVIASP